MSPLGQTIVHWQFSLIRLKITITGTDKKSSACKDKCVFIFYKS